jgi:hypothetical protein
VFYTCNIYDWRNVIHPKTTEIKYNKTPSEGMSPVVVTHHSVAAGGQHPRSTLRAVARQAGGGCPVRRSSLLAVPLSGAGAVHWRREALARGHVVLILILILAWFIVVARWIGCRCRCGVARRHLLAGAGSSVMVMVLVSFASSLVSYRSSSPFVVVTIPVVCRSPSPFPVIRCPAVHSASRGSRRWHKVGCGLPYNIFKT